MGGELSNMVLQRRQTGLGGKKAKAILSSADCRIYYRISQVVFPNIPLSFCGKCNLIQRAKESSHM